MNIEGKLRVVLVLLMMVALVGCGVNDQDDSTGTQAGNIKEMVEVPTSAHEDVGEVKVVDKGEEYVEPEQREDPAQREWILPEGFDPYAPWGNAQQLFWDMDYEDPILYYNEWIYYNYGIITDSERASIVDGKVNPKAAWDRDYVAEQGLPLDSYPGTETVIWTNYDGSTVSLAEYYQKGTTLVLWSDVDYSRPISEMQPIGSELLLHAEYYIRNSAERREEENKIYVHNALEKYAENETPWHDLATFSPTIFDPVTAGYEYVEPGEEINKSDVPAGIARDQGEAFINTGTDRNYRYWTTEDFQEVSRQSGVPAGYTSWKDFVDDYISDYMIAAAWIADPAGDSTYWATTQDSWISGADADFSGYTIPGLYVSYDYIAKKIADERNQKDTWYPKYLERMRELVSDRRSILSTVGRMWYEDSQAIMIEQEYLALEEGDIRNALMLLGMTDDVQYSIEERELDDGTGWFTVEGIRSELYDSMPRLMKRQLAAPGYFNMLGVDNYWSQYDPEGNFDVRKSVDTEVTLHVERTRLLLGPTELGETYKEKQSNIIGPYEILPDLSPVCGYLMHIKSLYEYLDVNDIGVGADLHFDTVALKYGPYAYAMNYDNVFYENFETYQYESSKPILATSFLLNTDFNGIGWKYDESSNTLHIGVATVFGNMSSAVGTPYSGDSKASSYDEWVYGSGDLDKSGFRDGYELGDEWVHKAYGDGARGNYKVYELICTLDDSMKISDVRIQEEYFNFDSSKGFSSPDRLLDESILDTWAY
jgi:hypothetical protein